MSIKDQLAKIIEAAQAVVDAAHDGEIIWKDSPEIDDFPFEVAELESALENLDENWENEIE